MDVVLGYYSKEEIDNLYEQVKSFFVDLYDQEASALKEEVDDYFNNILQLAPIQEKDTNKVDGLIDWLHECDNATDSVILYNKIYHIAQREFDDPTPIACSIDLHNKITSCDEYKEVLLSTPNLQRWDDDWFVQFVRLFS